MNNSVQWALLDHTASEPVRIGDMVSADAGGLPIYWVTAVIDGRALLSEEGKSAAQDMPLERFCWRGVGG